MKSNQPFQLDPVPPSVREEARQEKRERDRQHVAQHRARAMENGLVQLVVMIPKAAAARVEAFKKAKGFRNKSDAVALILDELPGADPDRARVSVSPSSAELLDSIAAAKGFKNRSQAIEQVLRTALAYPALTKELGL